MRRFLKAAWSKLPIIGGLCDAPYKAFREAAKELLFVWSLSLIPLVLTILIDAANPVAEEMDGSFWHAVHRNVKSGEVLIYINALIAPIGFILYKHNRDDAKFPNHASFMWFLLFLIPISAAIFALQRKGILTNPQPFGQIAITLFSIALLMRYTSMIYDIMRTDAVAAQREDEAELVKKVTKYSETR